MQILELVQGSPEWFQARQGCLTASKAAACFTTTGKISTAGINNTANDIAMERAGYTEEKEHFMSEAMQRGHDLEPVAREYLSEHLGCEIVQKGMFKSDCGKYGFSPDGIIENYKGEGMVGVEIKCPLNKAHIKHFLDGDIPFKYKVQMAYSAHISNMHKWIYCSYSPGARAYIYEFVPGPEWLLRLTDFMDKFDSIVKEKEIALFEAGV